MTTLSYSEEKEHKIANIFFIGYSEEGLSESIHSNKPTHFLVGIQIYVHFLGMELWSEFSGREIKSHPRGGERRDLE